MFTSENVKHVEWIIPKVLRWDNPHQKRQIKTFRQLYWLQHWMSVTLLCATCPRQWRLHAQYRALLDQGKNITCLFQPWGCLLSVESPVPSNLSAFSVYTEAGRPFTLLLHPTLALFSASLCSDSLPSLVRPVSKSSCPDGWSLFPACELAAPQKPLQAHPPYFPCLAPHLLTSLTISLTAGEGLVGFIFFVLLMNSCCWRYFCSRISKWWARCCDQLEAPSETL